MSSFDSRRQWVRRLLPALLVFAVAACSGPPAGDDASERPTAVESAPVGVTDLVIEARYAGEVAGSTADLAATVAGEIRRVHVRVGDRVAAGDALVELDDRILRHELEEARATLAAATARIAEARSSARTVRLELERTEPLAADGLVAEQQLDALRTRRDAAETALAVAVADQAQARARVARLEQRLADATLRAPWAGVVALRNVDPGSFVQVGVPLIRLVADDPLWLRFRVPERDLFEVEVGMPVRLRLPGHARPVTGRISGIAGEVSAGDRLALVEARLGADPGTVRPGQFGDVSVTRRILPDARVVPQAALLERSRELDRETGVFIVLDGRAHWRPVELRGRAGDRAAVAGDLAEGDRVLVMGHDSLVDGAPVLDVSTRTTGETAAP